MLAQKALALVHWSTGDIEYQRSTLPAEKIWTATYQKFLCQPFKCQPHSCRTLHSLKYQKYVLIYEPPLLSSLSPSPFSTSPLPLRPKKKPKKGEKETYFRGKRKKKKGKPNRGENRDKRKLGRKHAPEWQPLMIVFLPFEI
jgi:hypothetical protein